MFGKIINLLGAVGTLILSTIIITLLFCILPALLIWSINTLTEQTGVNFYIPHNIWTYLSVILIWIFISPVHLKSSK